MYIFLKFKEQLFGVKGIISDSNEVELGASTKPRTAGTLNEKSQLLETGEVGLCSRCVTCCCDEESSCCRLATYCCDEEGGGRYGRSYEELSNCERDCRACGSTALVFTMVFTVGEIIGLSEKGKGYEKEIIPAYFWGIMLFFSFLGICLGRKLRCSLWSGVISGLISAAFMGVHLAYYLKNKSA